MTQQIYESSISPLTYEHDFWQLRSPNVLKVDCSIMENMRLLGMNDINAACWFVLKIAQKFHWMSLYACWGEWKGQKVERRREDEEGERMRWNVTQVITLDLMIPVCLDNHPFHLLLLHNTLLAPDTSTYPHSLCLLSGTMEWDIRVDVINEMPINYRQLQVPLTTFVSFCFSYCVPLSIFQASVIVFLSCFPTDCIKNGLTKQGKVFSMEWHNNKQLWINISILAVWVLVIALQWVYLGNIGGKCLQHLKKQRVDNGKQIHRQ